MPAPSSDAILEAPPALNPRSVRRFPFVVRPFPAQFLVNTGRITLRTPRPVDRPASAHTVE